MTIASNQESHYIELPRSWENASPALSDQWRSQAQCESFNGKLRDELLAREIFYTLKETQILIERWRRHDNTVRPHSALGYRPPLPETILPSPELRAYTTLQPSTQGQQQRSQTLS